MDPNTRAIVAEMEEKQGRIMDAKVKHTQKEWTSSDFKEYGAVLYRNGKRIADFKEAGQAKQVELVARYCNAHDELVKTLRNLSKWVKMNTPSVPAALVNAEVLLAKTKAEGE